MENHEDITLPMVSRPHDPEAHSVRGLCLHKAKRTCELGRETNGKVIAVVIVNLPGSALNVAVGALSSILQDRMI